MIIYPKLRITPGYPRSFNEKELESPFVKNQKTIRPHSNLASKGKK